ncbi:MAG: hypothetical protein U0931_38790 [Vulcanimicrobiota bacterium]
MRRLFLIWLCSLPLLAISPHRLSLEAVMRRADWVGRVEILSIRPATGNHGRGLTFVVRPLSTVRGQPPEGPLDYWEAWPQQSPDGKLEAPIWTGSGLERRVVSGDTVYALTDGSALLRMEENLP